MYQNTITNVGQNIRGQNIPCHFLAPLTKHPALICHPGQNIQCMTVFPKQSFTNFILKKKKKSGQQNMRKTLSFNIDLYSITLSKHHFKLPYISTRHLNKCLFVRIPYFFEKSPLKNGDVLWGRSYQSFFRIWGRFDQFGDVLTRGVLT